MLKPSDQLRYRIGSEMPARPSRGSDEATAFAGRLPTMLWPAWSLPLGIRTRTQRELRPTLSCAILLVNSKHTLVEAAELLHSPISGHAVSYVLQGLEADPNWASIRMALIRIAHYLDQNTPPINYCRRRHLDYTELLPDHEWSRISRDTATPGAQSARARTVRRHLFETMSGLPAAAGHAVRTSHHENRQRRCESPTPSVRPGVRPVGTIPRGATPIGAVAALRQPTHPILTRVAWR